MPKRNLEISLFEKGLITSVNPQDIDVNAMSYSENLDANTNGKLQGILGNSVKSATLGLGYQRGGFLHRLTGQYDLIYTDGTDIKAILDFYGSPTGSTVISGVVGKTFLREGRHFYIGTGSDSSHPTKWVGYNDHLLFGGISKVTHSSGSHDDMNASGSFIGITVMGFQIAITVAGTPDKFQYSTDGGITYNGTDIPIASGNALISIAYGINIQFLTTTGHSVTEHWGFSCFPLSYLSSLQVYNAQLSTYEGNGTVDGTFQMTGSNAANTYLFRYKYSLIYDGVSESVLSTQHIDIYNNSLISMPNIPVRIWIKNGTIGALDVTPVDRRLTGINMYMAISADNTAANLGEYKLVFSADMTIMSKTFEDGTPSIGFQPSTGDVVTESGGYGTGADLCWSPIENSTYVQGITYQQNSGLQENADPVILNFELSAELNGYAFVANCYENSLTYADLMLFRSKAGAFGSFDIINDSMWLGFKPIATRAFNGKLYLWDSSHTYVVDPDGLFIQDILPGIGCSNDRSVEAIEVEQAHALVWSDANDIYLTQGSGIIPIGDAIKVPAESGALNWQGIINSNAIIIYDAVKQLILILISKVANTDTQVFAYHIIRKRWDYFPDFAVASTFITGAFMGVNGETYAATSANLYNNFGSTSNRAWVYIGSELIMGLVEQPKKYYNMKIDSAGTGTITPYYSIDKGTTYRGLTSPDKIQDGSGNWEKANSIRLKITGAIGTCYVNAIELLYRIMEGVR